MKSLAFVAITLLTAVNAASVTFKVIAPEAKDSVQVSINGQATTLKAADADIPYYTGAAELAAGASYKVSDQKKLIIRESIELTIASKLTFVIILVCYGWYR